MHKKTFRHLVSKGLHIIPKTAKSIAIFSFPLAALPAQVHWVSSQPSDLPISTPLLRMDANILHFFYVS